MHRRQLNHARLQIRLSPRGPILIKSGVESPDPTRPEMEFVRSHHPQFGPTVYLPGSSLKGALRNHAEAALRGLGLEICDPFANNNCSKEPVNQQRPDRTFRRHCPICQTFGSLQLRGRADIGDAYPWSAQAEEAEQRQQLAIANRTEERHQVGIDRRTGQAHAGALFSLEVATAGTFYTEARLDNFQLWQLALIVAVLREVDHGTVPIGFGKTRGLGQMAVAIDLLEFEAADRCSERLAGTGVLAGEQEAKRYGLLSDDELSMNSSSDEQHTENTWRGQRTTFEGAALAAMLDRLLAEPLTSFIASHQVSAAGAEG